MPSYQGAIIDSFLHTPWIGGEDATDPRGDRFKWQDDRRLRRVLHTFQHQESSGKPASSITHDSLLAQMDQAGVERALLPAKLYYPTSEKSVRAVHHQLNELCGSDSRLRWACSLVPPELGPGTYWDVMQNYRLVAEESRSASMVAVHITPSPWGTIPTDKQFYPAYAACSEHRKVLLAYVGMPGPLWPMEPNNPAHLDELALAFPDLSIVAHHIGDPWIDIAVRLAARHPNFYICTSAWSPKAYPQQLVDFLKGGWHRTNGSDKVLFATDYPLLDMQRAVRDARALDLTESQARSFLYENALKLYW